MSSDIVYITYILECIGSIWELTVDGREALMRKRHDKSAVLYYLHTLAEATQRISENKKASQPEINWSAI
ncbi:hypothetical protein FBQ95_09870 [Chloroflexi bacterium CFX3]|nr:hypothetical protein [Chloroflexi bacterium CFX3]